MTTLLLTAAGALGLSELATGVIISIVQGRKLSKLGLLSRVIAKFFNDHKDSEEVKKLDDKEFRKFIQDWVVEEESSSK